MSPFFFASPFFFPMAAGAEEHERLHEGWPELGPGALMVEGGGSHGAGGQGPAGMGLAHRRRVAKARLAHCQHVGAGEAWPARRQREGQMVLGSRTQRRQDEAALRGGGAVARHAEGFGRGGAAR